MSEEFKMTEAAKAFYGKLFFNVLLNQRAVELGAFDTYLCETDDIGVVARWNKARPAVVDYIREYIRNQQ